MKGERKFFVASTEVLIALINARTPIPFDELLNLIRNAGGDRTVSHIKHRVLGIFIDRGIVKQLENGKYVLTPYSPFDEKLYDCLSQLKKEEFKSVSVGDVANRIREPASSVEKPLCNMASKFGLTVADESQKRGLWNNLVYKLGQVNGVLAKTRVLKVNMVHDKESGAEYAKYSGKKSIIEGILVLSGATELVKKMPKFDILIPKREGSRLHGVFLTKGKIRYQDIILGKNNRFKVGQIERRFENQDLSFLVGHISETDEPTE